MDPRFMRTNKMPPKQKEKNRASTCKERQYKISVKNALDHDYLRSIYESIKILLVGS